MNTFNGDVLFELPPLVSPNDHFGQMQKMDRKHDGHAWYKVKTININNNFNHFFEKFTVWTISNTKMMPTIFFFLIKM
jgi:hypothetical protein